MLNYFSFIFTLTIIGSSIALTATGPFDGNDVIGPCIDNICPLQYECKNSLCTYVKKQSEGTSTTLEVATSDATLPSLFNVPASETTEKSLFLPSNPSFPLSDEGLTSPSAIDTEKSVTTLSDIPADVLPFIPTIASSPSSDVFPSSTSLSAEITTTPITAEVLSYQAPLSLSTVSPSVTTTKSLFDFSSPCFFGLCSSGFECKNYWCIRSSSTLFPTTSDTTPNPLSSSSVPFGITTTESSEITGPCIGNSCPDDKSFCKNGLCVRASSAPGTCKDKRFGCSLISYLCNIFTDLMTEDCANTCKKC